ncbi:hypothetical protein F3N42_09815 [Marinihelvus fidelis]|uniref:Uncharacterized protein n=1 Tax=Marinihelvus fidelis TaxID=2613842 RepID=A0A5N0T9H8_9GAMM|nr:hypothetical protein [Marinihelvus fidelis]KAA9131602.1 hypothetical protein F3N42_09815 [Marinihelvus fidelis]
MSMVFPDCGVTGEGGSVAYTGAPELGYEGVLSRAQRLSRVVGCDFTPSADAGLSGSYFAPERNGEGVIVEWLDNGMVTAIFFTFDTEGDQFWVTGTGAPNGRSVTMDVVYPGTSTRWGRGFDAGEIELPVWGTFTLSWSDCNNLSFSYDSSVPGYGSGSHQYTRISTLQGTSCPGF